MSKRKKKKILFILLILCLAVLLILIATLNKEKEVEINKQKVEEYEESIKEFQEFAVEFEAETILPRKIYELYNYNGNYENADLFRNMKVFADYLDYLQKNVTLEDGEVFYKQNVDNVTKFLGIENYDEFKEFLENMQNKDFNPEDFKYAEFVVGSSSTQGEYFLIDINFYYGEKPDKVTFTVYFANSKSTKIPFKYEFAKE